MFQSLFPYTSSSAECLFVKRILFSLSIGISCLLSSSVQGQPIRSPEPNVLVPSLLQQHVSFSDAVGLIMGVDGGLLPLLQMTRQEVQQLPDSVHLALDEIRNSLSQEWRSIIAMSALELEHLKAELKSLRSSYLSRSLVLSDVMRFGSDEKAFLGITSDIGLKGISKARVRLDQPVGGGSFQLDGRYNLGKRSSVQEGDRTNLLQAKYNNPLLRNGSLSFEAAAESDPGVGSLIMKPNILSLRSGLETRIGSTSEVKTALSARLKKASLTATSTPQQKNENLQLSLSTEWKGAAGTPSPFSLHSNLSFEERTGESSLKNSDAEAREYLYGVNLFGHWGIIEDLGVAVDTVQKVTMLAPSQASEVPLEPRAKLALRIHEYLKISLSAYRGAHQVAMNERIGPLKRRLNVAQNSNANQNMGGDLLFEYKNAPYSVSIVGFLAQLSDARTDVPTPRGGETFPELEGGSESVKMNSETYSIGGAESTVSYPLNDSLILGVTHLWNRAERESEGGETFILPFLPTHTLALHLNYRAEAFNLQLLRQNIGSQFEDERNILRTPAHSTLDVTVRKDLSNSSNIFLSAKNLLNEGQNDEQKIAGTTIGVGSPLLVIAGVTLRF